MSRERAWIEHSSNGSAIPKRVRVLLDKLLHEMPRRIRRIAGLVEADALHGPGWVQNGCYCRCPDERQPYYHYCVVKAKAALLEYLIDVRRSVMNCIRTVNIDKASSAVSINQRHVFRYVAGILIGWRVSALVLQTQHRSHRSVALAA